MNKAMILPFLLAGCATFNQPEIVKVPVMTSCKIQMPEKPDLTPYRIQNGDTVDRKAAKLAARELAWRDYLLRLETEARVCAK